MREHCENVNESDLRSNEHYLSSSEGNWEPVQIYDFNIFTTVHSLLHRFIGDQHIDRLPVGLLAQVVEHCTGIAEVMRSNSVQA